MSEEVIDPEVMDNAEQQTALAPLSKLTAIEAFTGDTLDLVLKRIEDEVNESAPDLTTAKGRDAIKAEAHGIRKKKVIIDNLGKALVSEWKSKSKKVDDSRRQARDFLDALSDKTRKPLTDWEAEQESEKAAILSQIAALKTIAAVDIRLVAAGEIIQLIDKARAIQIQVYQTTGPLTALTHEANEVKEKAIADLNEKLAERNTYDAEQAELLELRKLKAEAEQQKAKAEAKLLKLEEERAEEKRLEADRKRLAEEEQYRKELADKLAAEQKRPDADRAEAEAARKVEEEKRQKEREEQIRKDAAAKAIADAEAAQEAKEAMEAAKREADRKKEEQRVADNEHRESVEAGIVDDLIQHDINQADAVATVRLVIDGKIPDLKINY